MVLVTLPSAVLFGVPQGSVLVPILFVLYTADVLQLVKDHGLLPHAYADDTSFVLPRPMSCNTVYLTAWTLCHCGWQLIVYS